MTATIGIVAHTARLTQAEQLANQVQADYISVDDGTLGAEANHKKVWAWLHGHAQREHHTHCVVLEDDALPINNWHHNLTQALNHAPTPILSFYLGTSRPPQWQPAIRKATQAATTTGATWIISRHLLHAVAVAIPTNLIPDMLQRLPQLPIDEAITRWATRANHHIAYTWPSIADHNDGPTLIDHRDRTPRQQPRQAWDYGEPNWNNKTVPLGRR